MTIIECINQQRYQEALERLGEDTSAESLFFRLTCLFHLDAYEEVCELYEKNAKNSPHHYYENLLFYVQSLINSARGEEALKLMEEELKMPYIPAPFNDQFESIYHDLKRLRSHKDSTAMMSSDMIRKMLLSIPLQSPQLLIEQLQQTNIRLYLDEIKLLLNRLDVPRRFKSILIHLMGLQQVDMTLTMATREGRIDFNPVELPPLDAEPSIKAVLSIIEKHEKNPVILQFVGDILGWYTASIYPLVIEEEDLTGLSVAVHLYIMKQLNVPFALETYVEAYQSNLKEVQFYLHELNQIEP